MKNKLYFVLWSTYWLMCFSGKVLTFTTKCNPVYQSSFKYQAGEPKGAYMYSNRYCITDNLHVMEN